MRYRSIVFLKNAGQRKVRVDEKRGGEHDERKK